MEPKKNKNAAEITNNFSNSELYKSIFDNSNSAIFLTKPTGEILDVNSAAEQMFGYTKTELLKIGRQGILDHTDPHLHELLKERKENGKIKGELTVIKKNKERFPVEFTSSIFLDPKGEECTCTIVQDITNRKIAEQHMLLMLNNTEEGFILLDNNLIILNFNKQIEYIYTKYLQLEIEKGRSMFDFVKPERLNEVKQIYNTALTGNTTSKILETQDEDGTLYYFKVKYAPSKNEAGDIIGIFITLREITEETKSNLEVQKRQIQLEQAETNYRELFEKSIDGIFIHELESGRLLDANQKACEIFGCKQDEILTTDLSAIAERSDDFKIIFNKKLKAAAITGNQQSFEWTLKQNNGEIIWVEISLQKATVGGAERILVYCRLINDRKSAELESELQRKDKETLINSTDDLIWSIGRDLKIVAANNAYKAMVKMVTNKTINEGDSAVISDFDEDLNIKWKRYFERGLAGEKFTINEQVYNPQTESNTYGLVSFNPILDGENNIVGVACYSKDITELTEKQLAIEATKIELDNVMASSMDMICTVAEDNRIVRVSAASEKILGYKPEELIGKFIFDFVYEEDKEQTQSHVQEVISGKGRPNYYNRYVRKDGSLVYLEWTAQWDVNSKKRYGVARDVTAKVEAETRLKLSEQRFKSLVQDGGDLISIIDAEANYSYVSPTYYNVLGYMPEEFSSTNAFDFIHPDDVETVHGQFALLTSTNKLTLQPFRFKHKNGTWRWIETTVTNLMDEPSIQGIVANSRDITERKNIEEALLTTKENYKNLFENSPAPMFIFDFETLQIIDCNEETLIKYGYTKEEFLQLTIKDIRPAEDIAKIEAVVSNEESYGAVHKNVWRHKKKSGEIMYMDISGHLIDYNGKRVSFVMLIDVTEKLQLEEQREFEKRDKEALINNTEDLIWSVSHDLKLIAANVAYIKNMEKLTGLVVEPGSNMIMDGYFPEQFLNFWKTCYTRALHGESFKKEIYNEAMHQRSERWLEVNFNPIRKGNEITGVACNARDITDAKKAAEELKLSEEKYRLLFHNNIIPKIIYDVETLQIVEVNEGATEHYGFTKEEFLKISIKNLRPQEDFKEFDKMIKYEINKESSKSGVVTHVKKNGERIKVEVSGDKIFYNKRKCRIIVIQDVTKREATLKILKEKDTLLENAHAIAKLGYWQLNLQTGKLHWSKQIFKIWEISEDIIPDYKLFLSFIHPDDKEYVIETQNAAIQQHKSLDLEYRIILNNGKIKWIHDQARMEKNSKGERTILDGTAQDITERKFTEERIKNSNERYEHVTKATFDAIWEWDIVNNTIYRAEGFERTFGFNLYELNKPDAVWENFIHADDRKNANESIQAAIKGDKDYWSHEYRLVKQNGENAYVEDRAYILRNAAGEAQRIIGALRDITEKKYYHDLEKLDRDVLEQNAQGEKSIENVIGQYILGIQKLHPGMICSMQKLEHNKLFNLSSPDLPKDYLAAINGVEIGDNVGSCGTAAFKKEKIIVTDIATDIRWAKYKSIALKAGLKACWSHPIFDSKNNVVATFAIYYTTIKTPTAQEEQIIKRASNILQTIVESHGREAALQESNQRYLNVTKATFDAIWDWDIAANHIYWGETYRQLFGNFEDAHLSDTKKVIARLHPDERKNLVASAAAELEGTNKNWTYEHRYLKEDNTYAFVLNKALIVRDENGNATRVFGAMQDITQQKKEEQRLKLMSSVVTGTSDAVLITEAEPFNEPGPRIVYVNEAFEKLTGYTQEDLIGQTPRIFQGPKTDKLELKRLRDAIKNWEACEVTVINYKKNGEEFWTNFTISPVADEKGWFTHWISIERDVTDRKNEELQKELLRKIRIIFNEPMGIIATLDMVLKEVTLNGEFCLAESWLLSADKKEIKRATYYVADAVMRKTLNETSKLDVQKLGEGIVGKAWETQDLQTWQPNQKSINILEEEVLLNAGVKKLYALPFLNNAEVIGVLVLGLDKLESSILKLENLFSSLKMYLGAEIKRKQLEQELSQIFTLAPDVIAIAGKDGYFKKLNPAASELLEYTLEELMAKPFLDFVHTEDKNKTELELNDLITGKTTFYFENRYITKSGKIKWLAWTSTPSQEDELIFAVAKNITEKKDLEDVLDKANHLARIGSWELDIEKNSLYWSDITKEIHEAALDYKPSLHTVMNSYKKGNSRDEMIRRVTEATKNGTAWDVELEIITEKGNERWIRSIGETEFKEGKCIKVYGSFQDIDERKRAEENIRRSEQKRELIMNNALDAIICIDTNGNITFWNPQASVIFGWNEKEVIGEKLSDLIIPEKYRMMHEEGMKNYLKTGEGKAINTLLQLSAIKKTGEEFPIELTVLPIAQNGEEFFCAFIRDITDRKLSEIKLLELNTSLQRQTNEMSAINKELEQFAYVASHDLQEPLRMITSFITQLEKRYAHLLDEKGKKYIHFVVDGARRMRLIILDLLEYSKVGRIDEMKENIDLKEVIEEIKILYHNKIEEQQAVIYSDNLPVIPSYKSPVKQIFQNIISNALKYCETNRPCIITISSTEMDDHWQFAIKDNGIGINKEYFDKIFIIFQRLHTKEIYAGTGMGLAVTKKIIENLNGKIWLDSLEGEGTTFYFTLPK